MSRIAITEDAEVLVGDEIERELAARTERERIKRKRRMMFIPLALGFSVVAMPVSAQDAGRDWFSNGGSILSVPTSPGLTVYPLIVYGSSGSVIRYEFPVFKMKPGACLRGPLTFYDKTGAEVFTLADDAEYPTGCGLTKKTNGEN